MLEAVALLASLLENIHEAGAADVHAQHRDEEEVLQVEVGQQAHHSKKAELLAVRQEKRLHLTCRY